MNLTPPSSESSNKYYPFLAMLFITLAICDVLVVYRLVSFASLTLTAGVFVMPIYYMLEDVVAEIYGFKIARQMVFAMIFCMYVFSIIITISIHLPFPLDWKEHDAQYNFVLGHLFRTNILGLLSVLAGTFANAIIITKTRILTNGRYFWMRSLGSSSIGQVLATIIGSYVLYWGIYPTQEVFSLIWPVCMFLVLQNFFYSFIGLLLVRFLKNKEPVLNIGISVNPFA